MIFFRRNIRVLAVATVVYLTFATHWILSVIQTRALLVAAALDTCYTGIVQSYVLFPALDPTIAECAAFGMLCTALPCGIERHMF